MITEEKKLEFWLHFIETGKGIYTPGGKKVGKRFVEKVKPHIWKNELFWLDIIQRHGGLDNTPEEIKSNNPNVYNHCLGNFWGMLMEIAWKNGIE